MTKYWLEYLGKLIHSIEMINRSMNMIFSLIYDISLHSNIQLNMKIFYASGNHRTSFARSRNIKDVFTKEY